ncbi:Parallel beta-helix repeat [Arabidopsis thaliana x Arabidopsis arenosa]|uniref:Parallel beta-helix repeat n=1 Tax=Arabidopsis thaliana x Arabidopsis arenosa TaxID=1240361 RepID=A0A8T1YXT8_9BRAS|nr:Parallel beta-helix repeat [Arabidopsis thaliana x Arabidopsis arenosa]
MGRPKMKSSLFFVLLCLFQINNLGFCLEEEAQKSKNGVGSNGFISVTSFGAIGDGKTDDTKAFLKAWEAVCKGGSHTKILVPQGKTFMLKPLTFIGPCKSSSISFSIRGNLVAPGYTWYAGRYPTWISFDSINGLVVTGGGTIDARGSLWWGNVNTRPSAMHFNNCNDLRISNLRHLNSPRNHVGLSCSQNIEVTGIRMTAPGDSPNTDGIDISNCRGVHIHDSVIATGDDCIAINSGSSHINITGIFCGPGHGISVGSLGVTGDFATVEEVRVKNCTFTNTQNGVRIKTYQNGSGYARKISFEDIIMVASENPIIIDQTYHNGGTNGGRSKSSNSYQNCHLAAKQRTQSGNGKGVKVSDVRYSSIRGSSASDQAITLNCDADLGCSDIVMNNVNMVSATFGHKVFATCKNAHGSFFASKVNCLKKY